MRITLYLLTEDAELSVDSLSNSGSYTEVPLQKRDDINWKLFIKAGEAKAAKWTENVAPIVTNKQDLSKLKTQSSSGILLAEVSDEIFAITFGHGYHAVEGKLIVSGFGLRVAANIISADGVVSADTKGFNRGSRSQKTVLPAASQMEDLGIETSDEWVRQLSGRIEGDNFATTASGADSLRLSIKDFSMDNLPEKLDRILEIHESQDYKENFQFLDNFIRLDKKEPVVEELDKIVDHMLQSRDTTLSFAAPDPFEQKDVHEFKLTCRRSVKINDLTVDEVYGCLDRFSVNQELATKVSVEALNEDSNPVDRRFKLRDYIQAEIDFEGNRYALTSGAWFRINRDYLQEINDYIRGIDDISGTLGMLKWNKDELDADEQDKTAEGSYNKLVAKAYGYENLDKDDLHFRQYEKIEICDLLTKDRQLICVKSASKSSTLSHLFAQGRVSATLMHEPKYKKKLMGKLVKLRSGANYGNPGDWTFVYAIAIDKVAPLHKSLFFFSKVNLFSTARDIRSRGFKVALCKIDLA